MFFTSKNKARKRLTLRIRDKPHNLLNIIKIQSTSHYFVFNKLKYEQNKKLHQMQIHI